MKYKKYPSGHIMKIGDGILVTHCFGKRVDYVTRVTKTMAICEIAGQQPVRYPIEYNFAFTPKGTRSDTVRYEAIEIIDDQEGKE